MAAKEKKVVRTEKKAKETFLNSFSLDKLIPTKFQTTLGLLIILIVFLIFFSPLYFSGKTFQSGDIISIKSMHSYVENERDTYTLWNPYIFCGIPAYATAIDFRWWDFLGGIYSYGKFLLGKIFSVDYAMHTLNLILIAFTAFFFMRSKKASMLISLFVALATAFSTGIIVLLYIGHITKMISLAAFPLILLMLRKFTDKIRLIDFIILAIFLHFVVLGAHVQIIFYIFLSALIYYLYYFGSAVKSKNTFLQKQLIKSGLVFIAASIIAVLMSLDSYAQLWEYNKYSTRGTKGILENQTNTVSKEESDFYQYATNWSFSPEELMTFFVPSFYGFGNSTYQGELTKGEPVKVNTYFGQMPFVDVPMYMGVVVFVLALIGIFLNWKDKFVRYLTIVSILAIIISFGRTFPLLYDLFYNYVPFFDKFRAPSMILNVIQIIIPILAGYGLMRIILLDVGHKIKLQKVFRNITIGFIGLLVLSVFFNSVFSDWFVRRVSESGQVGQQLQPLYSYMSTMFTGDLLINLALMSLTFISILLFINKKISRDILVVAVLIFAMFDLFRINLRATDYIKANEIDNLFKIPEYISAIKSQNDNNLYRILNLKEKGLGSVKQNSNFNVYFLEQDFYGYSGIKPRTYQDIMDVVGPGNVTLWRMLNVKYLAFDKPTPVAGFEQIYSNAATTVYKNNYALDRIYFVDSIAVKPALEILRSIQKNEFDPKQIAYLEEGNLKVDKPTDKANVKLISYEDNKIITAVNATGNNFLFVGDTYYPSGWKALVDSKETKIYKANHGFRGIIVPAGLHKVEFRYVPESFFIGKYVSLIINILLIGFLIFALIKLKKKTPGSQL